MRHIVFSFSILSLAGCVGITEPVKYICWTEETPAIGKYGSSSREICVPLKERRRLPNLSVENNSRAHVSADTAASGRERSNTNSSPDRGTEFSEVSERTATSYSNRGGVEEAVQAGNGRAAAREGDQYSSTENIRDRVAEMLR